MHRIDTSTAQVDKFGVGKNGFTAGNPQTGELPTALDQDFFDSLQEELAGVIEGASIALSKTSRNQLLTALKKLFLQPGNNLSEIVNTAAALTKLGGAPLDSPTFTGTPKGPTAAVGTSNTQLATTAFVQSLIAGLLKASNNLSEIAVAGIAAQALARGNIGLGTAAVANIGTGANQIPDMNSFASTLSVGGIQRLPGGYARQWGSAVATSGADWTINFPVAFLSAPFAMTFGCRQAATPDAMQSIIITDSTLTNTGVQGRAYRLAGSGGITPSPSAFFWMAEGRI
ncbi:RNA polymerase beta [Erwinia rhapontici]|uniref:gp53-like domain-containing protein n=1 Tax=Erwinia rhapontici TaxID=55212 RepID=UPI0014386CD5|nr:RNA polymerase beta [Erwinia rhapontici]NKG32130.1 RNA polymerase beta [Erwinia rhapontici]